MGAHSCDTHKATPTEMSDTQIKYIRPTSVHPPPPECGRKVGGSKHMARCYAPPPPAPTSGSRTSVGLGDPLPMAYFAHQ